MPRERRQSLYWLARARQLFARLWLAGRETRLMIQRAAAIAVPADRRRIQNGESQPIWAKR